MNVWKNSLIALGFCLVSAAAAAGQARDVGPVRAQVDVRIEVVGSLSVIAEKGVRFGDVRPGDDRVFVPWDNDRAGMFIVRGREGTPVTISFTGPQGGRLERLDGTGSMQVSTQLYGSDRLAANAADPLRFGETVTLGEDGTYYFFLQAALEVMEENQNPPGDYEGTFTLEVEYQ